MTPGPFDALLTLVIVGGVVAVVAGLDVLWQAWRGRRSR